MFKIEKSVPIPKEIEKGKMKGATHYFRSLEIGDSFTMPENLRNRVYSIAIQIGIKLQTKKESDGLIRVWRIA